MDVFLTNVATQLLSPVGFSLWLTLLGVLLAWCGRRRVGHGAIVMATTVLWLASISPFSDFLRGSLERRYLPMRVEHSPTADAIVVLGGAIGTVRPPRLTPDLSATADRVLHAARLYRAGKAPVVIACGGGAWFGATTVEARAMVELLAEWGVSQEAILVETRSLNTYQNAVETKSFLEARGFGSILLVTSALHMRRALATFQAAGIEALAAPTDFEVIKREAWTVLDWLPDAAALDGSTRAIKEYLGLVVYQLRGWS